ncbi:hypothetical protein JTE90_004807 [Oedothorax gibbosus]|uniref:J domain-containing protein n=1 Tax=Oedothorax gibbosus TaxID=931172 RepID=A0AAV6VIS8_9ARAC|nr:hypothetical protein JTE90_004807 [Oedothorax gibbosus]
MLSLSSAFLKAFNLKSVTTKSLHLPLISLLDNKRFSSQPPPTLYSVLGLEPGATDDQIKQAYYNMSKMYHPDRNIGNETAGTKILEVNQAFEVLGNKAEREKYDKKMFPALNIKKPKSKPFIYEHTEYYEPPMTQKSFFRKANPINCTYDQYSRHARGEMKRKKKHMSQKYNFSKNMSCTNQNRIFSRKNI